MKPPILIIGAGPSGSILALALLHHGIPVRIIESSAAHPIGQWHSSFLLPRALELLMALGVVDEVLECALRVPVVKYYESADTSKADIEFEMAPRTEPTPASPFLSSMLLSQPKLAKVLHAALARKGCVVEKGIELMSFEQFPDCVNVKLVKRRGEKLVQEEERYKWMVGADGAAPVMRELLGLQFFGDDTTVPSSIGEIRIDGLPPNSWHMWGNPPRENISLRATEDPGVFAFHISGRSIDHAQLCENDELVKKFLCDNVGATIKFGDVLWSAVYKAHAGMIDKFLVGRVLLTGVATSPICNQALALAIQDACNVAWKLALVHRMIAPYSLLSSYSEERLPVVAAMIEHTFDRNKIPFREKAGRDDIKYSNSHQLGVNYRWSSIVFDERKKDARERAEEDDRYFHDYDFDGTNNQDEEVLDGYGLDLDGTLTAGDRAPDAPGLVDVRDTRRTTTKTWRLFQIFGPSCHTVLVFIEATHRWQQVLRSLVAYPQGTVCTVLIARRRNAILVAEAAHAGFVLEDRDGHAHNAYVFDSDYGITVVRPDGVVGALAKGINGVKWYFRGIFAQSSIVPNQLLH